MNAKIKKIFLILFVALTVVCAAAIGHIRGLEKNIADEVLRLHVVANSDSARDQEIKLKVRDAVLNECGYLFRHCKSTDEAAALASENAELIKSVAYRVLSENGAEPCAAVEVEQCSFPTKEYGDLKLPAGRYTALNIKIGSAEGKNWWCVMYPPLCLNSASVSADEKTAELLRGALTREEFALIMQSSDVKVNLKFKIAEIIGEYFD